ncbi:hypothetical protein LTR27_008858 [Elasticomyces elasticus]|nr:hypothetical protein LTR27_008858 [Elasticomyces elasticus]
MSETTNDHLMVIKRLLDERDQLMAEKDRLIVEKDELVESKNRLWQALYQVIRERDVEIDGLKAALHGRGVINSVGKTAKLETAPAKGQACATPPASIVHRNPKKELSDEYAYLDECDIPDNIEAQLIPQVKREASGYLLTPSLDAPDEVDVERPQRSPLAEAAVTVGRSDLGAPSSALFTFAPLIEVSAKGAYELGRIGEVAAPVLRSIESQLQTLRQREAEGKSHPCPGHVGTPGCMWTWMHKSGSTTRWTVEDSRSYACAACFSARRACLLWLGHMKWIILPLPPLARQTLPTWQDADYYILQKGATRPSHLPGVWQESKHKKARLH